MTQKYQFLTGVETAEAPSVLPASAPGDTFVLGNQTKLTIVDNQSSAADVTDAVWDKATYRAVFLQVTINRIASGGGSRVESGIIMLVNNGTDWEVVVLGLGNVPISTDSGVTFSVTASGQLQYVSDANGGIYSASTSWLKWKILDLVAA